MPIPQHPTDLLGRSIAVGDLIVCPRGKTNIEVSRIEKIKFFVRVPGGRTVESQQGYANGYTLHVRPVKSTRYIKVEDTSGLNQYPSKSDVDADPDRYQPKLRYITGSTAEHIVKLEPMDA